MLSNEFVLFIKNYEKTAQKEMTNKMKGKIS